MLIAFIALQILNAPSVQLVGQETLVIFAKLDILDLTVILAQLVIIHLLLDHSSAPFAHQ